LRRSSEIRNGGSVARVLEWVAKLLVPAHELWGDDVVLLLDAEKLKKSMIDLAGVEKVCECSVQGSQSSCS
jgi:hypothetical protein